MLREMLPMITVLLFVLLYLLLSSVIAESKCLPFLLADRYAMFVLQHTFVEYCIFDAALRLCVDKCCGVSGCGGFAVFAL